MADNRTDDITDLTEDEAAASPGKGKKPKAKKPAPPQPESSKDAKPDKHTNEKPGKKKGKKIEGGKKGINIKLILIIVPVVLVAACVAAVILNFFGARDILSGWISDPLISAVVWLDPEFSSVNQQLRNRSNEREEKLDKRSGELDTREGELNRREEGLQSREEQTGEWEIKLDKRSEQLDKREEQLRQAQAPALPAYQRELTEQELSDMRSLSRSYAQMDPEAAAAILTALNDTDGVATIIYHMSERNAALILAAMDKNFAAKVTDRLLQG